MNSAQQTEKDLPEELRVEQVAHQTDVTNLENHLRGDIERLQVKNAEVKDRLAKADARIVKLKERLHKFTTRAIANSLKVSAWP